MIKNGHEKGEDTINWIVLKKIYLTPRNTFPV
jgi:hypothetical protein